jgi:hypothetical protein
MVISTDLHIFHGYTTNQLLTIVWGRPMVIITDSSSKVFVLHQQRHTHTHAQSFIQKQWKIKQISILRMLKQQFRTGPRLFSRCLGGFVFNQGWWSWIVNFHQICLVISRYLATLIVTLFCRWFRFADFDFFIWNIFVKPKMCFVEHLVILSSGQSPVPSSSRHWNPAMRLFMSHVTWKMDEAP